MPNGNWDTFFLRKEAQKGKKKNGSLAKKKKKNGSGDRQIAGTWLSYPCGGRRRSRERERGVASIIHASNPSPLELESNHARERHHSSRGPSRRTHDNARGPPVHVYKPDCTTAVRDGLSPLWLARTPPSSFRDRLLSLMSGAPLSSTPPSSETCCVSVVDEENDRGLARRFAVRARGPGWSAISRGWGARAIKTGAISWRDRARQLWAQLTPRRCLRGRALAL